MNITHVNQSEVLEFLKGKDPLTAMFDMQRSLMAKYSGIESKIVGNSLRPGVNIDDPKDQYLIKDCMWRIVEELGEAANCLKNKPWKQTEIPTDQDHFIEELMDAWHFLLQLFLVVGIDEKTLVQLYVRKALVNKFRQRSNY